MTTTAYSVKTEPVNGTFKVDGNHDTIKTSQSKIGPGYVQFTLEDAPTITWWKGIKLFDSQNNMISLIAMQDQDHGPDSTKTFPVSQFGDTIKVELWKAKTFGIHCCVGTAFFNTSECGGHNTTLFWQND